MSLDELLRAVRDGDPGAEQRLFRRLRAEMLPFFKKRVNTPEAEDLTQHTLEIIASKLKSEQFEPQGPRSFRSFAFVIAHYRLLTHRNASLIRRRDREAPGQWVAAPTTDPAEVTLLQQQAALLREAMAAITTRYRRALESRLRDEDPHAFAAAEGIDLGTVRSRVRRAVLLIRAEIRARRRTPSLPTPT